MNILIFASTVIVAIIIAVTNKLTKVKTDDYMDSFWERERKANFARKQDIESLDYITVPDSISSLPYNILDANDSKTNEAIANINMLKDKRMLNLSGYTNTDLKLTYGAANINALTEYDGYYQTLVVSLQSLAEAFHNANDEDSAVVILEYATNSGSDISKSYKLLADIYKNRNNVTALNELKAKAEKLTSLTAPSIISYINELLA